MEMFLFPSCFFLTLIFLHLHFFVMLSSFRFPIPCAFHLPQFLFLLFIVCMVFVSPFLFLLDVGSCRLSPRCHTLPRCSLPFKSVYLLVFYCIAWFLAAFSSSCPFEVGFDLDIVRVFLSFFPVGILVALFLRYNDLLQLLYCSL